MIVHLQRNRGAEQCWLRHRRTDGVLWSRAHHQTKQGERRIRREWSVFWRFIDRFIPIVVATRTYAAAAAIIKYRLSTISSQIWTAGKWSGPCVSLLNKIAHSVVDGFLFPAHIFSFFAAPAAALGQKQHPQNTSYRLLLLLLLFSFFFYLFWVLSSVTLLV